MKLCHAVSIGLGLKGVKIVHNIVKGCVHACLSNWHPNLWSSFNSKKLVKSETPSCSFVRVCLEGPKIALNIVNVSVHSYPPNAYLNLWLNSNSKKLVKSETPSCCFTKVVIKRCENRSECRESWSARLSIKWSKSIIKFQFWEICQKWNSIMRFR